MANSIIDPKDPDYCETCGGECVAGCWGRRNSHRQPLCVRPNSRCHVISVGARRITGPGL